MSIAAIVLLATLTGTPVAQDDNPRVETRSEVRIVTLGEPDGPGRLDADGDGVVTREEFSAPMGAAFDRLDGDDDGRLTTEELAAGHGEGVGGPGGAHVFTMRRPGGPEGGPMIFHDMPDGGDVRVFSFRHGGPEGGPHPGGPGERRVEVRRFGGPGGHDGIDADNDGKVSEEEFLAPLREVFRSMDADRDGALGEGEGHPAPPPPPAD